MTMRPTYQAWDKAVEGQDWTALLSWPIPSGITVHPFEVLYMDGQGLRTVIVQAPSLNLAVRWFIRLDIGQLWQVRQRPLPTVDG